MLDLNKSSPIMLNRMKIGSTGTVVSINGDKSMLRKLMSLGIKTGSDIEILHHRGKGVVVRSNGTRIAVGESIAEHVMVVAAKLDRNAA